MGTKQVIVMPEEKTSLTARGGSMQLRKGKLVSQGSHGALAFLTRQLINGSWFTRVVRAIRSSLQFADPHRGLRPYTVWLTPEMEDWMLTKFSENHCLC